MNSSKGPSSTSSRARGVLVVAWIAVAALFLPALIEHIRLSAVPSMFNDDARQWVFPFFRYTTDVGGPDLIGDYHLAVMPIGYAWLYRSLAAAVDPEPLSKFLPYVLLIATLIGVAMTSRAVGGSFAAPLSVALVLQAPLFMQELSGGLPRSFAFPFVALGSWALVSGRPVTLAALTAASAAFYPLAGLILGLMLAGLLLVLNPAGRGSAESWRLGRRLGVVAAAAAAGAVMLLPTAMATTEWGRLLGPDDASVYAEAGPQGRWGENDMSANRSPFPGLITESRDHFKAAVDGSDGLPILEQIRSTAAPIAPAVVASIGIVLLTGLLFLLRDNAPARRSLLIPFAGIVGFVLAKLAAPYLYMAPRYLQCAVPLFVVSLWPATSGALLSRLFGTSRVAASAAGATLVVLLLVGGRGSTDAGLGPHLGQDAALIAFVRSLPPTAFVAGWPSGAVENVPYASRRRAFVTEETDKAAHERYVQEMRRRKTALAAALFGSDEQDLLRLRDDFGVTHLIVDRRSFEQAPEYYVPFVDEARQVWAVGRDKGFAVVQAAARASVFDGGSLFVLDLSKL